MFQYLKNLSTTQTYELSIPPQEDDLHKLPETLKSKDDYRRWCLDKDTDHIFASHFHGIVDTQRVGEANQPLRMVGYIADYDTNWTGDALEQIVSNVDVALRPRYLTRTFSGGIRLWYVFEQPVIFTDVKIGIKFTEILIRKLKARAVFPGFDDQAARQYWQYYEIGHSWQEVPASGPISTVQLEAWMFDAVKSAKVKPKQIVNIPFEKIREALSNKYPGAWPGGWDKFEIGSRGNRFWDGGNATSCIVREDGITAFTGDVGFKSWGDLLGKEWMESNTEQVIGEAIKSLWYEPTANKYWRSGTNIGWQPMQKEDMKLHMRSFNISDAKPEGENMSPMDRVLHLVQTSHCVNGSFPFHFNPKEIVQVNGSPFLNVAKSKLAQPDASRSGEWGDGFPNIAEFYEGFYDRENHIEQFVHAMGELMHFYQTAYQGDPQRGRVLIHAGPAGAGKTFNLNIFEMLFSGTEDAASFLLGKDTFNGSLVSVPVWTVDDAVVGNDHKVTLVFSQMIKNIAACDKIPVRGMYKESVRLPWLGRVVVLMNNDPESIRLLPSTEGSLMDKVCLFQVQKAFPGRKFPTDAVIRSEIPAFCSFLLEGKPWLESFVPDLFTDPRWGTKQFHHEQLIRAAQASQISSNVEDLLALWRTGYFAHNKEAAYWEGNPTELMESISCMESLSGLMRCVVSGPQAMGRSLAQIESREIKVGWLQFMGENRKYRIFRDDNGTSKVEGANPF
jgi:hypothetical protein